MYWSAFYLDPKRFWSVGASFSKSLGQAAKLVKLPMCILQHYQWLNAQAQMPYNLHKVNELAPDYICVHCSNRSRTF